MPSEAVQIISEQIMNFRVVQLFRVFQERDVLKEIEVVSKLGALIVHKLIHILRPSVAVQDVPDLFKICLLVKTSIKIRSPSSAFETRVLLVNRKANKRSRYRSQGRDSSSYIIDRLNQILLTHGYSPRTLTTSLVRSCKPVVVASSKLWYTNSRLLTSILLGDSR